MANNILSSFFSASFIFIVIRVGVPLLFASMSAYVASLAGIPNIAVEGIMIFGALFGVYFSALGCTLVEACERCIVRKWLKINVFETL